MRELTVSQQETVNGGWNWYEAGEAFTFAGGLVGAVGILAPETAPVAAPVGADLWLTGAACDAIGWISSHWF